MPRNVLIKLRSDTAAHWATADAAAGGAAVAAGETVIVDGDLVRGDGVTAVVALPRLGAGAFDALGAAAARAAVAGDIGGTAASPTVTATHLSSALPLAQGGTAATSAADARTSLGLGGASVLAVGTTTGTVAAGDDSRITGALSAATAMDTYAPLPSGFYTLPESARSAAGAAINAAITEFGSNGGTITVPAGDWHLGGATINLASNVTIRGAGPQTTKLIEYGDINMMAGSGLSRVTVQDMFLVGAQNGASGNGSGIKLTSSGTSNSYIRVTNVALYGFDANGVDIQDGMASTIEGVTVTGCQIGFCIHGGGYGTSVRFASCYANANRAVGYDILRMTYLSIDSCSADNQPTGYLLDDCSGVTLSGCGAENNTANSLKINGGSGVGVAGFFTGAAAGQVIYVTGSAGQVVLDRAIEVNPAGGVVNHITVDTGCTVALLMCKSITANSLAGGTTTTIV
jgi:hypothetical protein